MRRQRAHSIRSDECDLEDLADGSLTTQPPNHKDQNKE